MIALDKEDFQTINNIPFVTGSDEPLSVQIGRMPEEARPAAFILLQTLINNINSEYRLVELKTIKEKEVTDVTDQ